MFHFVKQIRKVLQKEKIEPLKSTGEPRQFLIPADWIIENDLCQTLCVILDFFVKWRGFGLFFAA